MEYISQIERVRSGLYWTVALVGLFIGSQIWSIRPRYVLPPRFVDSFSHRGERLLRYLIFLCLAVLPLQITLPSQEWRLVHETVPIYVLLDSSLSMSADDVEPSRFAVAQELIAGIVGQMEGLRVGVAIFSGIPLEIIPLSEHIDAVSRRIEEISLADFPVTTEFVGTAVGDALLIALERLEGLDNAALVLISDGSSSRGVDAMEAAYLADQAGVPIYTVAIGQDDFVVGHDAQGNEVIAAYETETLQSIAQMSHGRFFEIETTQGLTQRLDELITELRDRQQLTYRSDRLQLNRYLLPLLFVLVALYLVYKVRILIAMLRTSRQ